MNSTIVVVQWLFFRVYFISSYLTNKTFSFNLALTSLPAATAWACCSSRCISSGIGSSVPSQIKTRKQIYKAPDNCLHQHNKETHQYGYSPAPADLLAAAANICADIKLTCRKKYSVKKNRYFFTSLWKQTNVFAFSSHSYSRDDKHFKCEFHWWHWKTPVKLSNN